MPARRPLPTRPAPATYRVALGLGGGAWYGLSRPQNPPVQAAAHARTVAQDWAALRTFGPRPVGEEGHTRALDWLAGQLRALGPPPRDRAAGHAVAAPAPGAGPCGWKG